MIKYLKKHSHQPLLIFLFTTKILAHANMPNSDNDCGEYNLLNVSISLLLAF